MSLTGSSVFDKFTFFGVLIPGLYTSALLLPLLPFPLSSYSSGIVIYLVVISFILGLFANALGEPLRNLNSLLNTKLSIPSFDWWLADSITVFKKIINKDSFDDRRIPMSRDLSYVDEALVDSAVEHMREDLDIPLDDQTLPSNYDRAETVAFYQYMLNQVWATSNSPAKIHHSVRMFTRSLVASSLLALVAVITVVGTQIYLNSPYKPAYFEYLSNISHPNIRVLILYAMFLGVVIYVAIYIHKRYTYYLCMYMLSEFVHQHQQV